MGTWDPRLTAHAWGRGTFLLRGAVKSRFGEQLGGPEGIATLDGTGVATWRLESLTLSASFRALGAPRTQTSQAAGTQDPLELRAAARRTPARPPGGWAEARRWRCWALATTSLLEREGGEPFWRWSCACREQTDPRRWQEVVSFKPLGVPEPDCPQNVVRASTPPAGR